MSEEDCTIVPLTETEAAEKTARESMHVQHEPELPIVQTVDALESEDKKELKRKKRDMRLKENRELESLKTLSQSQADQIAWLRSVVYENKKTVQALHSKVSQTEQKVSNPFKKKSKLF